MKKIIGWLVLGISITGKVCAQEKTGTASLTITDKTFEIPANTITRRFFIDLGKGNKMQLELTALEDIDRIKDIDSLVKVFLHDIIPLKDSLADELTPKRIDFVIDSMGRKKIRLQQYPSKGSSFLVDGNDVAALKLEQDTINITGMFPGNTQGVLSKKGITPHYYRVSFFVNQITELPNYLDGKLNEKMSLLDKNKNNHWSGMNGQVHLDKDPTITSKQPGGHFLGTGDFLELHAGINLQNYKNYFIPGFNISADVFISSGLYKYQFGVAWEPQFLFAKNSQGNLQTFRNDFIILTLGREPQVNKEPGYGPSISFFHHLSLGYLVGQRGGFMDAHTFRIGTGGFDWNKSRLKLEPLLYFHDFFRNVTPGLKVSMNF
jgi:hypothetical protein